MSAEDGRDIDRVRELWDRTARERASNPLQGWLDSPIVLEKYVNTRISGSANLHWLTGLVERLRIPRTGRWLSLGCGAADQEIGAARAGLFASLLALDASPVSIEQARQKALDKGISNLEFGLANLNALALSSEAYDVVLMNMSLHHVKELGRVLSDVERAMAPDGVFIINEFVGPAQFQFTDVQLALVRELLEVMPERWRRDGATGEIKHEYVRLPVGHWDLADPSEAIRSDRILAEIEERFEIRERVDYGGTILNLLLEHIVHNFDPADEKDVAAICLLAKVEDVLIRSGVIPSDFTIMAMRKWSRFRRLLRPFRRVLRPVRSRSAALSPPPRLLERDAIESWLDFSKQPNSGHIVSGFHHWEGTSRWMSRRGDLLLRMISNRMSLVLAAPFFEAGGGPFGSRTLDIRVRLSESVSGRTIELEPIHIDGVGPVRHSREIPERFASVARGRTVHVVLECPRVWVPARMSDSKDFRELAVQVVQVGFEPPA